MPTFDSHDGLEINYIDEGAGEPIVLVHGFASSLHGNWRAPGIVDALVAEGRRVVALDCRGHGRSGKPHDPAAYGGSSMGDDVIALMDHLGIAKSDLMGYSMGGFISASLLAGHPERFRSAILSGVGGGVLNREGLGRERSESIARALESSDGGRSEDASARGFRAFAEQSGNDLGALAALQRSNRHQFDSSRLRDLRMPVMVLVGEKDDLAATADALANAIPGARLVKVPGDHLTAVGTPEFRAAVVSFLREASGARA